MQFIKNAWNGLKRGVSRAYDKAQSVTAAAVGTVGTLLGLSAPKPSYAAPPDLTSLAEAVDFSTVTTALLGVASAIIVVYLAWKGAKMVIAAVRGA